VTELLGLLAAVISLVTALLSVPSFRSSCSRLWRRFRRKEDAGPVPSLEGDVSSRAFAYGVHSSVDTDDGVWIKAVSPSGDSRRQADLLVVFVHGLLGSANGTWGQLPALLRAAVQGVDFDILSFEYPSGMFTRASIELGVAQLEEVLWVSCKSYKHLIFITHSTGGLVVKQVLCRDMKRNWQTCTVPVRHNSRARILWPCAPVRS